MRDYETILGFSKKYEYILFEKRRSVGRWVMATKG